jgi:hypothetical protein
MSSLDATPGRYLPGDRRDGRDGTTAAIRAVRCSGSINPIQGETDHPWPLTDALIAPPT